MRKRAWVALAVGALVAWQGGSLIWIATAPAAAFRDSDFVRPANASAAERDQMFDVCMTRTPAGVSPQRKLSVCTCQKDRLPQALNRADYLYAMHLSNENMRQANGVLKGLAAAHRPHEEILGAGRRGTDAIRETIGACLQARLTDDDMRRIGRSLEQRGIAPSSGTNRLADE